MALTQSSKVFNAGFDSAPPTPRNNVIPFPSPRALLVVTFLRGSEKLSREQLRALLHSPLGVYVISTKVVRDEVHVQFDIAPEDLDFTIHTLIATLPEATIGPIRRRSAIRDGALVM
jgi:hypothetical protein